MDTSSTLPKADHDVLEHSGNASELQPSTVKAPQNAGPSSNPDVQLLTEMFPTTDKTIIEHVLGAQKHDLNRTVNILLRVSASGHRSGQTPVKLPMPDGHYVRPTAGESQTSLEHSSVQGTPLRYEPRRKKGTALGSNGAPPLPERPGQIPENRNAEESSFLDTLDREMPVLMEKLDKVTQEAGEHVQRWVEKAKKKYQEVKTERAARVQAAPKSSGSSIRQARSSNAFFRKNDDFGFDYEEDNAMIHDNELKRLSLIEGSDSDDDDELYATSTAASRVKGQSASSLAQPKSTSSTGARITAGTSLASSGAVGSPVKNQATSPSSRSASPQLDAAKLNMLPKRQIDLMKATRPTKSDAEAPVLGANGHSISQPTLGLNADKDDDDEFVRNPFDEDDD